MTFDFPRKSKIHQNFVIKDKKKFLYTLNITFFERSVSVERRQTYKKYNKR